MLATIMDALEASRVASLVVVVNPLIAEAIQVERPPTNCRHYVINDRPDSQMIESIQIGLARALRLAPAGGGVLICPGDHPCIRPQTIDQCLAAFASAPDRLVIAAYQGRRAHPIILPADLARAVMFWVPTDRLDNLPARYCERVQQVEVDDPGILIDVDTPADIDVAARLGQPPCTP